MSRKYKLLTLALLAAIPAFLVSAQAKPKMTVRYGGTVLTEPPSGDGKPGDGLLIPCSWDCGDGRTGYCEPPTVALCWAEATSACSAQQ